MNKYVAFTLIGILIGGWLIDHLSLKSDVKQLKKETQYQKDLVDSVKAAKIHSDTVVVVKVKPGKTVYVEVPAQVKDSIATAEKDTVIEVTDIDSVQYKVPLLLALTYNKRTDAFGATVTAGILDRQTIINTSNVVTSPPIVIEPTFWRDRAPYLIVGAGVLAVVLLLAK